MLFLSYTRLLWCIEYARSRTLSSHTDFLKQLRISALPKAASRQLFKRTRTIEAYSSGTKYAPAIGSYCSPSIAEVERRGLQGAARFASIAVTVFFPSGRIRASKVIVERAGGPRCSIGSLSGWSKLLIMPLPKHRGHVQVVPRRWTMPLPQQCGHSC